MSVHHGVWMESWWQGTGLAAGAGKRHGDKRQALRQGQESE